MARMLFPAESAPSCSRKKGKLKMDRGSPKQTTVVDGRKRGSGVSRVYETLRNEIIELTLEPGSPVDEVQLAARFSLSRTPVREALARLAGDGLIETLPNRSTIVSKIDFLNLPHFFDALTLMYRVTARLAAANHRAEDVERLNARQSSFIEAVNAEDAVVMIATNRDFHLEIARAGRNPYYYDLFGKLLDEGRRILRLYYVSFNDALPSEYASEHEDLISAISERDVARADRLAGAHADQIVRHIQAAISADGRVNAQMTI